MRKATLIVSGSREVRRRRAAQPPRVLHGTDLLSRNGHAPEPRAGGAAEVGTGCRIAGLSTRELDVLRLIARGSTNAEIAATLFVSISTIKKHLGSLLAKTAARDRIELVVLAYDHGLVTPAPLFCRACANEVGSCSQTHRHDRGSENSAHARASNGSVRTELERSMHPAGHRSKESGVQRAVSGDGASS